MSVAPVISKVNVKAKPARAFELFFNHMTEWWRTCDGEKPFVAMVLEPKAGGRWYERDAAAKESEWGRVLAYNPPHRLLLGWGFDAEFKYNSRRRNNASRVSSTTTGARRRWSGNQRPAAGLPHTRP